VSVCFRKTVELNMRLDTGKGVFLDDEFILPEDMQAPAFMVVLLAHISELRKSDSDRTIQRLKREIEDLKATIEMMRGPPSVLFQEECQGGCSRGGDGPACGKLFCKG
jgi:hypothetical protein